MVGLCSGYSFGKKMRVLLNTLGLLRALFASGAAKAA